MRYIDVGFTFEPEIENFLDGSSYARYELAEVYYSGGDMEQADADDVVEHLAQSDFAYSDFPVAVMKAFEKKTTDLKGTCIT
jgi:hypothetical protein